MIQRALVADDPAGGMWEFPGGHIEGDEKPWQAAAREWQEETGLLLPPGEYGASWTSPDGVYRGYCYHVPSESVVDIIGRGQVNNPDDPDGDLVEAVAWWDPTVIPGNPNVRGELSITDAVLPALVPGATSEPPEVLAAADAAATAAGVIKADPKG
jgi:8-oxo-dGTP pyrophosphatase MutT (NUDIX family)